MSGRAMRALVAGYHTMGCLGFDALLRHGYEVPAVFTHRDDPHEEIWWESLAERAAARGVAVHYPEKAELGTAAFAELVASYTPDFLFSFYFRFMLPAPLLALPKRGALNLHGSLLPRYRGRAPVNWVLVHGETETGVTLHYMVAKPDAGAIVDQERVAIDPADTALSLYRKLEPAALRLLDRALPRLAAGTARAEPMDLAAGSYFGGRQPADGRIDWDWPAKRIYALVRAVTHPYPGAFTTVGGRRLLIWSATWAPGAAQPGSDVGTDSNGALAIDSNGAVAIDSNAAVAIDSKGAVAPGTVLLATPRELRVATGDGVLALHRCQLEGEAEADAPAVAAALGLAPGARFDPQGDLR